MPATTPCKLSTGSDLDVFSDRPGLLCFPLMDFHSCPGRVWHSCESVVYEVSKFVTPACFPLPKHGFFSCDICHYDFSFLFPWYTPAQGKGQCHMACHWARNTAPCQSQVLNTCLVVTKAAWKGCLATFQAFSVFLETFYPPVLAGMAYDFKRNAAYIPKLKPKPFVVFTSGCLCYFRL